MISSGTVVLNVSSEHSMNSPVLSWHIRTALTEETSVHWPSLVVAEMEDKTISCDLLKQVLVCSYTNQGQQSSFFHLVTV